MNTPSPMMAIVLGPQVRPTIAARVAAAPIGTASPDTTEASPSTTERSELIASGPSVIRSSAHRAREILAPVPSARLIATFEHPAVAALRVGQNLPGVLISIPEIKAIGSMLDTRLTDLVQPPSRGLFQNYLVRTIDLGV